MDIINLQYDIELAKANSMFEFALDNYYLECKRSEIYSDMIYMEDSKETANKGLISKFGEFIEKVIAAIGKFFTKIKEKIFGNKNDVKNKMKEAAKKIDPKTGNETVEIPFIDKKFCMSYEEYISKMEELENKLITISEKYVAARSRNMGAETPLTDEYERQYDAIIQEMEYLQNRYSFIYPEVPKKYFNNMNESTEFYESSNKNKVNKTKVKKIKKKDLISGEGQKIIDESENDLKVCKEKTDKFLKKVKNDSKKCKDKKIVNALKKMISFVSSSFKKISGSIVDSISKHMTLILGITAAVLGARQINKKYNEKTSDDLYKKTKHSQLTFENANKIVKSLIHQCQQEIKNGVKVTLFSDFRKKYTDKIEENLVIMQNEITEIKRNIIDLGKIDDNTKKELETILTDLENKMKDAAIKYKELKKEFKQFDQHSNTQQPKNETKQKTTQHSSTNTQQSSKPRKNTQPHKNNGVSNTINGIIDNVKGLF